MPDLLIRDVQSSDRDEWATLYAGYREFYRLDPDSAIVDTVWTWIATGEHTMRGLVAVDARGAVVALANLHTVARPSMGVTALYLDDLFTAPTARGRGAGAALLARAAELAAEGGHALVRWITASDNATARRLYDQHATATSWVTYDMPPVRR
ncbi:MAG: GNAT family N-acetyltransferase [Acidobacteria bacterium]|nr:GNAT family N-acetyltransferase [Acidobacteriota bacterium]